MTEILSLLSNVKKTRNGFLSSCPSHEDKNPSLSIKEADGKILLKCFVGCTTESILSALGLSMKDLFTETKQAKTTNRFQSKKIVAVYEYRDEKGEILYENVRYEPKGFQQRKPNGAGGYDYSLNGTRRVPYRLPDLLEAVAQEADVWLCEGEKDADNLRALGFAATNFKNWKREFNHYLKTANVCLIQDHDKAGLKEANHACKLLSGNVASLRTLDLYVDEPLPEKHGKDFSDWLESEKQNGLSNEEIAEELSILADNTTVWQQAEETEADAESTEDFTSLFNIQPATKWIEDAKLRPVPKMLFGELWFESELCIVFADTGKGKTILAVQIADAISKGKSIPNFTLEAKKQTVLYFDFELSDKQFEARYSTKEGDYFTNHFAFDQNFQRGEINQYSFMPKGFKDFESYLNFSLEYEIAKTGAKVLIVDNITYLKSGTETAKDALPLMKELIRLKKKFDLSILALAHTPKRDLSRPFSVNDLQGSKMLSNFADSIFAIGESAKDKNLRYLKQIKARNTEVIYDAENVAVCQITKPDNFLMFEFLSFGNEREHLKQLTDDNRAHLIQEAKKLSALGKSQRAIATELGISAASVNNYLKK